LLALAACGGGDDAKPDAAADTCAHAPGTPVAVGTIDVGSSELSGLAASHTVDGLLWTHGDHGGTADIYSVSATTAAAHGTLHLETTPEDWEDIATGPCIEGRCIYVADTGDNDLNRASIAIVVVPEPASDPIGVIATSFVKYDVMYPDGPHNVEAVFIDPRDQIVYAIEKVTSKHANVYKLPLIATTTSLAVMVAQLTIPGDDPRVTAADLVIDDCNARLAIRTYGALYELRAAATATIPELLGGALATMPVADEPHGEAVAYSANGHAYFTTSEGELPALNRVSD
jgi:hypothetical protein